MTTRILVVGGRGFRDRDLLFAELDRIHNIYRDGFIVITWGDTVGASALARRWAYKRRLVWMDNVFSDLDYVIAFPGTGIEKPLQHAWKKRIPALKIFSDGSRIQMGRGLLKNRRAMP